MLVKVTQNNSFQVPMEHSPPFTVESVFKFLVGPNETHTLR